MLQFLKYTLATIVGLFLFMVISFFILIGIATSAASEKEVEVKNNSVLEIKLDKPIAERAPENPFGDMPLPFGQMNNAIGLDDIKNSIKKAKSDSNVKGIYLNLEMVNGGMATLEEIRNELLDFKKSDKFIVAYGELITEKSYYLASVADKIYLNPVGTLELNGLSSEVMFFKGTLEKLNLEPYIFRVGTFKSAVEPFMLEKMSDASREQVTSFLNSLNDFSLKNMAASRKIELDKLKNISDSMLVHNAEDALKYGLVTDLAYYDEVTDFMKSKMGLENADKLNLVPLSKYKKTVKSGKYSKDKVAVIYASGDIVGGKGDNESIGSTRFAEAIREARLDKNVKAVVLRINSPGGSALASDVIWREVVLTKKEKPIIASMSDVAASGGYYIAMACDTIVAQPNTITGSIGVFGLMVNAEQFLKDKLGITVDRVKTGKFSDVPSITRPMTAFEKQVIQQEVERIYTDFVQKAAKGRNMPVDKLESYASGRVWSGIEAKERGLVDVLGGIDQAIAIAVAKAGLDKDDFRIRQLPEQKSFIEELMSNLQDEAEANAMQKELGDLYPYYKAFKQVGTLEGVQARLPFELEVQ